MHPGDSFYIPFEKIDVLALPSAALMKLSESVDYLRAMAPRRRPHPPGDPSDAGTGIHYGRLSGR